MLISVFSTCVNYVDKSKKDVYLLAFLNIPLVLKTHFWMPLFNFVHCESFPLIFSTVLSTQKVVDNGGKLNYSA